MNISDGGKNLEKAMGTALLLPLPNGVNIEDFVIKVKSDTSLTANQSYLISP